MASSATATIIDRSYARLVGGLAAAFSSWSRDGAMKEWAGV
jgi:hypothetical protein